MQESRLQARADLWKSLEAASSPMDLRSVDPTWSSKVAQIMPIRAHTPCILGRTAIILGHCFGDPGILSSCGPQTSLALAFQAPAWSWGF